MRAPRVTCTLDVTIHDSEAYPLLGRVTKSVNVSATGILMQVPTQLDASVGQEVVVTLRWPGGIWESEGRVVRLETAAGPGGPRRLMGVHMQSQLPDALTVIGAATAA
jgi:hypothetical protein